MIEKRSEEKAERGNYFVPFSTIKLENSFFIIFWFQGPSKIMISSKSVSEDYILDIQILPKNTALSVKYVEKFR